MGPRAKARGHPHKERTVSRRVAAQGPKDSLDDGIDFRAEDYLQLIAAAASRIAERRRFDEGYALRTWLPADRKFHSDPEIAKRVECPGRVRSRFLGEPDE